MSSRHALLQPEVRLQSLKAEDIVHAYEGREVSSHPYFVHLAERPVDLGALWLLVANLREGISGHFVRWLATTIARMSDLRISSLLAKQLDDELGKGDMTEIHSLLLDRFIVGLAPWRLSGADERLLKAGRRLAEAGARPFIEGEPYEAVGALMVGEIFAKKMDRCLGDQIRRQSLVSPSALKWLVIHETLEVDHADDSMELAMLIDDPEQLQGAWRGAHEQWQVLWEFLDQVLEALQHHSAASSVHH